MSEVTDVRQVRAFLRRSVDAELETQRISHSFSSLLSKVQQSIEKRGVTTESFIAHLKSVRGVESVLMYSQRPLVHACMDQIQIQKSVGDIIPLVSGYFSWFNHLPIEKMIEAFCEEDTEVMGHYKTFKAQFEDFCVHMVNECHKNGFGFERTKDAAKIIVKFDLMGNVAKVNELVAIRNIVALQLKVKKHSLYLSSVECDLTIEVTFLSPLFVAEAAFPLTAEQEKALGQCGVLQVQCGGYKYSSPAWSGEGEAAEAKMGMAETMWYMSMMTVGGGICRSEGWKLKTHSGDINMYRPPFSPSSSHTTLSPFTPSLSHTTPPTQTSYSALRLCFRVGDISVCNGGRGRFDKHAESPHNLCEQHEEWRSYTSPATDLQE